MTKSWGNKPGAVPYRAKQQELVRAGKLDEILQIEVDWIQDIFGAKYDNALAEMLDYSVSRGIISSNVKLNPTKTTT